MCEVLKALGFGMLCAFAAYMVLAVAAFAWILWVMSDACHRREKRKERRERWRAFWRAWKHRRQRTKPALICTVGDIREFVEGLPAGVEVSGNFGDYEVCFELRPGFRRSYVRVTVEQDNGWGL